MRVCASWSIVGSWANEMTMVSHDELMGELMGWPEPWPAPAKLNLCLHIVGRRADGYHLLQSALQFIDLCDELAFYSRPNGIIERIQGPAEVPADKDLVIRAARLLAKDRKSVV